MTVGSQVKACFYTIKQMEATLEELRETTQNSEAQETYTNVHKKIASVREDLASQILHLENEEPQYE